MQKRLLKEYGAGEAMLMVSGMYEHGWRSGATFGLTGAIDLFDPSTSPAPSSRCSCT